MIYGAGLGYGAVLGYGADLWGRSMGQGGALGLTETPSKAEELRARYISAVIYGAVRGYGAGL